MSSNSALPLKGCVTLGKRLMVSGPVSFPDAWEKATVPPSQGGGEN